MKQLGLFVILLTLSACGPKVRLVSQAYMPEPPAILMEKPKELHTIKNNNLTVTDSSVAVNGPKR